MGVATANEIDDGDGRIMRALCANSGGGEFR